MSLDTASLLEGEEKDEERHGYDTTQVEGGSRLAGGHGDELLVPQGLVGAYRKLQDHFLT